MKIAVGYQDQSLAFEIDEDRVVGHWSGPKPNDPLDFRATVQEAFEAPRDFPPMRRAVVPGDQVVVPLDPATPDLGLILEIMAETLRDVEIQGITVVSTAPEPAALPNNVSWRVHDPEDRSKVAYLASTSEGRRVYLSRYLTDADIVIPIGTLGYDGTLGYRGPWSVIYPGLSDSETQARYRSLIAEGVADRERPSASLIESAEVTWLLGCQFQVGVLPGVSGVSKVVAGLESAVRSAGAVAIDENWSFKVPERADVVVAGIGAPGRPTSIDDLAEGLATATRLVRRGGKIVALSRAQGEIGTALRRISGVENSRAALNRLRGHEADADYLAARRLAESLAWADVYLHSALDPDHVEDLGLIALGRPEEARKLVSAAPSCLLVSQADRTRALVTSEI
jgi:lactate racemase